LDVMPFRKELDVFNVIWGRQMQMPNCAWEHMKQMKNKYKHQLCH